MSWRVIGVEGFLKAPPNMYKRDLWIMGLQRERGFGMEGRGVIVPLAKSTLVMSAMDVYFSSPPTIYRLFSSIAL